GERAHAPRHDHEQVLPVPAIQLERVGEDLADGARAQQPGTLRRFGDGRVHGTSSRGPGGPTRGARRARLEGPTLPAAVRGGRKSRRKVIPISESAGAGEDLGPRSLNTAIARSK